MNSCSEGQRDSDDHEEYPWYPSSPPESSLSLSEDVVCGAMDRLVIDSESAGVKGPQCEEEEEGEKEEGRESVGEKRLETMDSAGDTMLLKAGSRGMESCVSWAFCSDLPWTLD
jgi:hypothetical protein